MSTERYSSLSQTLTHPPGVAIAHSRLFCSFLAKLRDLILSVCLHQKCIKLAEGLLFSVTSILHLSYIIFTCLLFFVFFFLFFSFILFFPLTFLFFFFRFEDMMFAGKKTNLCWLIQQLSLPLFFLWILKLQTDSLPSMMLSGFFFFLKQAVAHCWFPTQNHQSFLYSLALRDWVLGCFCLFHKRRISLSNQS